MESQGLLPLVVAFLALLSPCLTSLTPRISFPIGSPGRSLVQFTSPNVTNMTTLLLSDDGDTLFVGARDAVLSLDVSQQEPILIRRMLDWPPSKNDVDQCAMKGQKMTDCSNFIRVLQFLNSTHMYACGTFAFRPHCAHISAETLTVTNPDGKPEEGKGRCPYDPYQRNTAITVDGELYTGTVADYRGNRPVISRHLSEGSHVDLKLDDTLGWLEDPTFIGSSSIPSEEKVYFFFSEVGKEYDFIDKLTVSRVAQICTSDIGGQRTLQRRWTTFAKAQLLCQADNELPYNVIQDIVTLSPPDGAPVDDTLFYGIFTSQWSVNSGRSAVCAFRLGDIKAVFSGNYKVLNRDTSHWSKRVQEKIANPGECGLHNASDNTLRFVKENFLADDSVRPGGGRSLTMVSPDQTYSQLTVQRVRAANNKDYTVLFLLAESGYLQKVVLLEKLAHIIEEVQVFTESQPVKSLVLSVPKGVVFVGTANGVVKVPTANCSFYSSCAQCVLAQDPFCGWNPVNRECVDATKAQTNLRQDVDGGNVEEMCHTATLTPRAKFGSNNLPNGKLELVSLNEVVQLRCPEASRLARRRWERPNSRLSQDLYMELADGSLRFIAAPATLGAYLCQSVENGYQQTLAVYQVAQKSSPDPPTPATSAPHQPPTQTQPLPTTRVVRSTQKPPTSTTYVRPVQPETEQPEKEFMATAEFEPLDTTLVAVWNFPVWADGSGQREDARDGDPLLQAQGPSYLRELVVVSVLLALTLSLLFTTLLYSLRQRCHTRTVPQAAGTPTRDCLGDGDMERESLRGQQSPRSGSKCNNQANGQFCNRTPKGSNGHLPNIPI